MSLKMTLRERSNPIVTTTVKNKNMSQSLQDMKRRKLEDSAPLKIDGTTICSDRDPGFKDHFSELRNLSLRIGESNATRWLKDYTLRELDQLYSQYTQLVTNYPYLWRICWQSELARHLQVTRLDGKYYLTVDWCDQKKEVLIFGHIGYGCFSHQELQHPDAPVHGIFFFFSFLLLLV